MGRPTKDTAEYFPHTTAHKKTMFIIEGRWGNDGYAMWFKLLECLGNASGHYYDCKNQDNWEYLYTYARVTEETATDILDKLADLGAIDYELWRDHKVVWSDNFIEGLRVLYVKRKQALPTKPSFRTGNSLLMIVSEPETPPEPNNRIGNQPEIDIEEKREEESSREETTTPLPPQPDEKKETAAVVFKLITENICPVLNSIQADMVRDWVESVPRDWITAAVNIAALKPAKTIKYIDSILRAWAAKYKPEEKPWEVEADGKDRKTRLSRRDRAVPTENDWAAARSRGGW